MYSLVRKAPTRELALRHLPAVAASLLLAEMFYRFHSFTLECLAFLGTWFLIDALWTALARLRTDPGHGR